ncbi:NADPH-dependent FMN reductase [Bifidobacterium gallicum]|uniref:Flavin reductase n=1 Tax=Bifidobacterium gallicum DSM 20093 = LMG 11596 TaxID=561180 RepID=D1NTG5_9BIFI|nr:NADPH-dependent FMN reductase [Bifidobacterium gallicum]EFA23019.1 flavin reductase [Bifidobacterium gallicum DSM 20093 = LMG 11596]KFI57671.1 NADH-ubiquinone oxidoreductase [Bifidobacterium gallicum DSM 20093 = LMG 11596]
MATPNIAFVESSLDGDSFESKLARKAIEALGDRAEIIEVDYKDLPLLNEDENFPDPDAALAILDKFKNADAVWVFISEYKHNIPVAVKNLFDWLTTGTRQEAINQKPVAITGVGGFKGIFGRIQLGDLLEDNGMRVFPVEVGLSVPEEAFKTGDWVFDEADVEAVRMQATDFLKFIEMNEQK